MTGAPSKYLSSISNSVRPSLLSTSSTLLRSFEPGVDTFDLVRLCALRIRVIISPIGSFRFIAGSSLPARLDQPGDQPLGAKFPYRDAAHFQFAVIGARAARHLAAVADANRRAVARQRRKLDGGLEALF